MTRDAIETTLIDFISTHYPAAKGVPLDAATALLDTGIIDSMGVLDLVLFVEERFAVTLSDDDMLGEHFVSASALAALLHDRLASTG